MKNKDIIEFLNFNFPLSLQCEYDNCGFLIGDINEKLSGVMLCLDVNENIIKEANKNNCNLIISHHPLIFNPVRNLQKNNLIYKAVKSGLNFASYHTNFDASLNGMNFLLCKFFNLKNINEVIVNEKEFPVVRYGDFEKEILFNDFLNLVKKKFGLKFLKASRTKKNIKRLAFCGGSGSDFLKYLPKYNIDAYISSEIKLDKFIFSNQNNILLIDAGHFETENIMPRAFKSLILSNFKNINVRIAHNNLNPVLYY